jgi:DNA-binding winged helix-turn-helix (wHTH) protein/tetratricopeptide (TPR) repeat protein
MLRCTPQGCPGMQGTESCPTRRFGVFEVDLRAAELRKRGVRIKLQEQPFQILSLLLDHPGELVTREELRHRLWPAHTFVDFDRSLNKAMTKLRSALGDSPESPRYVETIPRHGYRFLPPVYADPPVNGHKIPTIRLREAVGPENHSPGAASSTSTVTAGVLPKSSRYHGILATVLILLVGITAYLRLRQPTVLGGSGPIVSARRSVAVLGFKNLSGDAQEAWLSTALSDWLTTELTAGEQIRAIPAENIARMKLELALPDVDSLSPESLLRIRRDLGTDLIVVGSYAALGAKSDGQIRLDLRLQDTQSGETIDSVYESGSESHLLNLVSSAGERLRNRLGVRSVTSEEAAEVAVALPTRSNAAKLYSEGLAKLRVFDARSARDLLQKAVAAEPSFALSHVALASTWFQLGYEEKAKAEAKKAFDLSSNLPRAERLLVEGRYTEMSRNWSRAIEIYRALFDFFPDNLDYGLALTEAQLGANKWKDALDTVAALRSLPAPLCDSPQIDFAENYAAQALGDMKRADQALTRAAEKAKTSGASLLLAKARRNQAWLYENSGKQDRVEAAIREAKLLYLAANDQLGVAQTATLEGIVLERQGDYFGARKKYEESMTIYREAGSKQSLSNQQDNLGDVLLYVGDLGGARRNYAAALATYQEIGDQNGVALAKLGLGDVLLALGKLPEAAEMYKGALDLCRGLGNPQREASALAGLARIQRFEGDSLGAQKNSVAAFAKFSEASDDSEAAHIHLQLAQLALDAGKSEEATASAEGAVVIFEKARTNRYTAEAELLLARALLAQRRMDDAVRHIQHAIVLAKESHNVELDFGASITAARLKAASGNPNDIAEAFRRLRGIAADASTFGFAELVLEARLALAEIEVTSGNPAAPFHLQALEKDSREAGILLVAQRAADALPKASRRPSAN